MAHDTVRFVTIAGNIDFKIGDPQAPFVMAEQVNNLRASGYLMNDYLYVPVTSILAIFTFDSTAVPGTTNNVNLTSDKGRLN